MEGLVKTAWTNKQSYQAALDARRIYELNSAKQILSSEEIQKIKDHLKHKEGLDIGLTVNPDPTLSYAYHRTGKSVPFKHGEVQSPNNLAILSHELGHAIDHKRHPRRPIVPSNAAVRLHKPGASAAIGGAVSGGSSLLANDENHPLHDKHLTHAQIGGGAALGAVGAAGLLLRRISKQENNANLYGRQLIRDVYGPEEGEKLIKEVAPVQDAFRKTYSVGSRQLMKNYALAGAGGAIGGVGLAALINQFRNNEEENGRTEESYGRFS